MSQLFVVIYPVDFETNGHIVDDEMHAIMVRPLPPGCRMTAIFDVGYSVCICGGVGLMLGVVLSFWNCPRSAIYCTSTPANQSHLIATKDHHSTRPKAKSKNRIWQLKLDKVFCLQYLLTLEAT